jgi:hypothetical protein
MDQTVSFAGKVPSWPAVADLLARRGFPAQLRMIDGELAFPDEVPPEDWRELRVGTPQGMVTQRREGGAVVCVTWGNADAGMRQAWNALAWAFARAGGGQGEGLGEVPEQLVQLPYDREDLEHATGVLA